MILPVDLATRLVAEVVHLFLSRISNISGKTLVVRNLCNDG